MNAEYTATIEGDVVKVGCQTFDAAKILELAEMITANKNA